MSMRAESGIGPKIEEYCGGPGPFAEWLKKVNAIVERNTGVSIFDLPDWCYYDEFQDQYTPLEAAQALLAEECGLNV